MKITKALQITLTKFRAHPFRNVFTSVGLGLGMCLTILGLMAITGIDGMVNYFFDDYYDGKAYIVAINYDHCISTEQEPTCKYTKDDVSKRITKGINPKQTKTLVQKSNRMFTIDAILPMLDTERDQALFNTLRQVDKAHVNHLIHADFSFEDKYGGKIPVILPSSMLPSTWHINSNKEVFLTQKGYADQLVGKTFKLSELDYAKTKLAENDINIPTGYYAQLDGKLATKSTDIEVIVVGINKSYTLPGILIPEWAYTKLEKNTALCQTFSPCSNNHDVYLEFDNANDVWLAYNKSTVLNTLYSLVLRSDYAEMKEGYAVLGKIITAVGVFLLCITSLLTFFSIGKVAAESSKEIALYRAVGARRGDIRSILYSYTLMLTACGFAVAIAISLGFATLLSVKFGPDSYYSFAAQSVLTNVAEPGLVFVTFPLRAIVAYLGLVLLVSLLAAFIPIMRASLAQPGIALKGD